MPAETMSTPRTALPNAYENITAREIDFVHRFSNNWEALRQIMGIMRPIRKAPGTQLVSYTVSVELENGDVPPGAIIPFSKSTAKKMALDDVVIQKYGAAVTLEEVSQYGAAIAIQKKDDAFLNELQNDILTRFYAFLKTGSMISTEPTWQRALAMAKGNVLDKFNKIRKPITNVVGFANVLDYYDYLGNAQITVQTELGLTYIKNFMGYSTLFLLSAPDIERGKVIALPVENIDLYYMDPEDTEYAMLGLQYTVKGDTNLIGFHAQGNYSTATGETYAILGMTLWAEYIDGIAVVTVQEG